MIAIDHLYAQEYRKAEIIRSEYDHLIDTLQQFGEEPSKNLQSLCDQSHENVLRTLRCWDYARMLHTRYEGMRVHYRNLYNVYRK